MHNPLIGVLLDSENGGGFSSRPYYALRQDYFAAIEHAGGIPVGLSYTLNPSSLLDKLDGVLVPGGDYRFPKDWYEDETPSPYQPNEARLNAEITLLRECLKVNKPLLGICCGMQVMAAITGGKLKAKLATHPTNHRPEGGAYTSGHPIQITPQSLLHRITGQESVVVNTHHAEGIVKLGYGTNATAIAPDGVIEAIEVSNHLFALGLQWHPEVMVGNTFSDTIFTGFVTAAKSGHKW
jgi:putative glutamine amidotransferase